MTIKQENESSSPYLQTNLSAKEHERLTDELKANPELLRKLLRHQTPEDKKYADALLFNELNAAQQSRLDEEIRRYLLGDPTFTEEEIAELEELMIDDERYFERMMMIETELIEDYSRGALSADKRDRFKNYFLITPERREKLNFVEAMALSAAAAEKKEDERAQVLVAAPAKPPAFSLWQSLRAFMRSPNLLAGTAAASVLLFLTVGTLWWFSLRDERQAPLIVTAPTNESIPNLNQSTAPNQPVNTSENGNISPAVTTPQPKVMASSSQPRKSPQKHQAQKQSKKKVPTPARVDNVPDNLASVYPSSEDFLRPRALLVRPKAEISRLKLLQTPKKSLTPSPVFQSRVNILPPPVVFDLLPGMTRSEGSGIEKKIEPGTKVVVLQLRLDLEREYDDFRIVVQDSDGNEVERGEKLKSTKTGSLLTFVLPAESFKPNDYTVILSGGTKGVYKVIDEYSFRVLK